MRGWRLGATVSGLLLTGAVASASGSVPAPGGPFTNETRLGRSIAERMARPPLMPILRSVQPLAGIPGRTGLVRGTIGKQNLAETILGFGKLWVIEQPWRMVRGQYHSERARVISIDVRTHRTEGEAIPVGRGAFGMTVGAGSVWVVNSDDSSISRIDPGSRRVVATIAVGARNLGWLVVSHGQVWMLRDDYDTSSGGELIRIDPATNHVTGRTLLGKNMCGSFGMVATRDALWVTADAQGTVIRIDPLSGRVVARIHVDGAPIGPIVAHGMVWVANEGEGSTRLWRVDPATNEAAGFGEPPGSGWMLQPAGGKFWTTDGETIRMIDPESRTVEMSLSLPGSYDFRVGRGTLWAVSWDSGETAAIRWVDLRAQVGTLDLAASRVA
jgi:YVTN family beta-propeller protein